MASFFDVEDFVEGVIMGFGIGTGCPDLDQMLERITPLIFSIQDLQSQWFSSMALALASFRICHFYSA